MRAPRSIGPDIPGVQLGRLAIRGQRGRGSKFRSISPATGAMLAAGNVIAGPRADAARIGRSPGCPVVVVAGLERRVWPSEAMLQKIKRRFRGREFVQHYEKPSFALSLRLAFWIRRL